jgi:hypothetical protein
MARRVTRSERGDPHAEVDLARRSRQPGRRGGRLRVSADPTTADAIAAVEEAIASDSTSRPPACSRVRPGPAEIDLLHACLAAAIDPSLLRVFAYVQDHAGRAQVTDPLVARLFGHDGSSASTATPPSGAG